MALQTSFSPSSSSCCFSSSSFSYAWEYDVFLSFRGPDTRHGFIGHLHKALSDKGIRTFIDDEELQRGEKITHSLAKAIEESRIAIPVFSKSYASSSFCLDELVKIMECVKGKGRLVLPLFYDVEPCDVRHQSGSYGEALARLEERFKCDKERVKKWRKALRQAANLSGEDFKTGNEYERDFIVKIVKEISKRISRVPLHVADHPVGLESRVLEVNWLLNYGSECGVHMIGIYGIGGIGKTTLAKAVYNSIADQFESLCFIENMSELLDRHGLVYLQEMVLSKILGGKVCNLASVGEGISIIKERLRCKKVLLVLDNVDKREQLQEIIGSLRELGSGSKVIITTRDKHLLTIHGVEKAYEVKVLNEKEAVELFSWKAFKFGKGEPCYMDISKKLVTYASGLPLALEVIGSNLFGRCVEEWRSALDEYQKIPNGDVQKKLKVICFDVLGDQQKEIFLDIACCFKGYKLVEVVDILHAHYDVDPKYSIQVLIDKSLIKINNNEFHGVITLHDLIQDMGRKIVRLESPMPGARSRLWLAKEIIEVLQGDKGSSKIQLINLECDYNGDVIEWGEFALKEMNTLRTLIIKRGRFSQGHKYLPKSLRVFKWEMHPLQEYLQFDFHPEQLIIFALLGCCFDSIQVAELLKKKFENIKVLKFDYCKHITKIPNLSSSPKLEVLSFACCDELTEIDESVGYLDKLKTWNAMSCGQLRSLPSLMLPSLEHIWLDGCSSLESFPEILGKMESMKYLRLHSVPIKKFPYSIHNLTGLRELEMAWGDGIVELPSSIALLENVEILEFCGYDDLLVHNEDEGEEQVSSVSFSNKTGLFINDCNISEEFFRIAPVFPRLVHLHLERVSFRILPRCIDECQFLRKLHLIDCEKLEEIRGIPPNIEELFVVRCTSLSLLTRKCIDECQFLRKIHLFYCKKLKEIRGIPPNIEELFVIGCTSWSLLTGRMLLNKKLHEEGQDRGFILPWKRLPMWFEYQRRESSITFWFRNKFPAISFVFFFPSLHMGELYFRSQLTINGAKSFFIGVPEGVITTTRDGLVFIFNKTQTTFRDKVDEVLLENEWNCAVFSVYRRWKSKMSLNLIEVGVHIIKEKSCMDDVRFTDPLVRKECGYTLRDMGHYQTHAQLVQQQQQQTNSAPLGRLVRHPREFLFWPIPPWMSRKFSKLISSTTTTLNVQDRGAVLNPVEYLDDVYGSSNLDSDSEPQSLDGSDVEQPLDDAYNNSDSEQSASAIHGTNGTTFWWFKDLLLPDEDECEEQVSSMSFSNKTELEIYDCLISEEFFRIVLPTLRLQSLCMRSTEFSIVPECIGEFQFLRSLKLIDCKKLQEIRGIPPNIEELFVDNCTSLWLLTTKCIEECQLLTKLHLIDCDKLVEIPRIPPNIEELFVVGCKSLSHLTIKCIKEHRFLTKLHLIDCTKLEEFRGILLNIEELFVVNCVSLSALTRERLLSQTLHEEGQDKMVILPEPEQRLPMWFEYRRRDLSIAFWFRNKFPAICFGLFTWSNPLDQSTIRPRLTINGAKSFQLVAHDYVDEIRGVGHILIFSKTETTFRDQVGEAFSENEWKRAVIDVYDDEPFNGNNLDCVQVGIHIIKEKSCMDDIRFTDPLSQNQCDTLRDVGYSPEAGAQFVQQQTYSARFLEWQCDTVKFHPDFHDVPVLQQPNCFHFWYKQEEQNLISIDQHNLEECESFGDGNGKNPLTELLSTAKPKQLVILDLSRNCSNSVWVAELLKEKFESMRVLKFDYCEHITKIPNLSSAPKLEVLSFVCCYKLTEIDESVGSLDKLKTLDAYGCHKLRSLPPLMLPSLKYLNLKSCSRLESFPEILGKMECVTRLFLSSYHIKKLPYSIHNLTGLQSLSLEGSGPVELPNGIMLPGVERLSFNRCDGLLLPIQDEGEEQVSSTPFPNTAFLRIFNCIKSEKILRIAIPMFPRLQFLCLERGRFIILPECIGEFQLLRRLILIDCWGLEIRGIPPSIEELWLINCKHLSSSTREMLLNKKLYEEGQDKTFILPWSWLPLWFEYQRKESSITFWFRNKFPAISFGVFNSSRACFFRTKLTINGTKSFQLVQYHPRYRGYSPRYTGYPLMKYSPSEMDPEDGLICIISKTQTAFRDQVDEALSENEWNRAVFSVYDVVARRNMKMDLGFTVEVGVHIIEESSSMDDIRFTDPLLSTFNDNVNGNSNSKRMSSTTTTLNVQDLQEEQNITSIDQHKLEGCESVDKACNSNARGDKGKNPLTELPSTTKNHGKDSDGEELETTIVPTSISEEETKTYQPASNDETMAWDPMELEYQLTIGYNNKSTRSNETRLEELPLAKGQFCLCSLFSCVTLCFLLFFGFSVMFFKVNT